MSFILVFLGLVVFLILWFIGIYNGLVTKRNITKNSFAQIDVQLKRRYDLIPNLVETVKGAMNFEKQTLEAVIQARNQAFNASQKVAGNPTNEGGMKELMGAESALTQSLSRFMAVVESYPDLKTSKNIGQLMEELTSTENKISYARQAYNDSVMFYNNAREVFPSSFVAAFANFTPGTLYEVTNPVEREAVKVKF